MTDTMPTFTPTQINETYDYCRLRRHETKEEVVAVPGFMVTPHAFRKNKLEASRLFVIRALKLLPKNIRRSNGCQGVPWFTARHIAKQDKNYGLEVIDRLLAMAVGLGLVTVVHPEGAVSDVAYIIIEDLTAARLCRTRREYSAARWED